MTNRTILTLLLFICLTLLAFGSEMTPPEMQAPEIGSNGTVSIRWTSLADHVYTVHHSTNLLAGFSVQHEGITAQPPMNTHTDNMYGATTKFWKVSATNSSNSSSNYTFVMIHFEAGYKGRLDNDLPIDIPSEYMTMTFGWQEYLFETAEKLIAKADDYGFHLTLAFNPQWAEYILLDSAKIDTVKGWQERGHEIAFHHHSINHPDWNGYSNDPNATNDPIPFLGDVDVGLDFVRNLGAPTNVTTAMIGGLPVDMPQSYDDATEELIFAGGSQYDSFERYGELRSLRPHKIKKSNGAEVIFVAHRQLTTILTHFTVQEALDIFKTEYSNIQHDEIYGVVFHCYDYHEAEGIYTNWFEFIKNSGDSIKTINEVISDYIYPIPIK